MLQPFIGITWFLEKSVAHYFQSINKKLEKN